MKMEWAEEEDPQDSSGKQTRAQDQPPAEGISTAEAQEKEMMAVGIRKCVEWKDSEQLGSKTRSQRSTTREKASVVGKEVKVWNNFEDKRKEGQQKKNIYFSELAAQWKLETELVVTPR